MNSDDLPENKSSGGEISPGQSEWDQDVVRNPIEFDTLQLFVALLHENRRYFGKKLCLYLLGHLRTETLKLHYDSCTWKRGCKLCLVHGSLESDTPYMDCYEDDGTTKLQPQIVSTIYGCKRAKTVCTNCTPNPSYIAGSPVYGGEFGWRPAEPTFEPNYEPGDWAPTSPTYEPMCWNE